MHLVQSSGSISLTDVQPALPRDGKPYKEEEESRAQDQGTNSALSPTLDAATKLFDMIFFDDHDIEEEEDQKDEALSVPINPDADIFLGIVDSLTLTTCKALDLSSLLDEDVEEVRRTDLPPFPPSSTLKTKALSGFFKIGFKVSS